MTRKLEMKDWFSDEIHKIRADVCVWNANLASKSLKPTEDCCGWTCKVDNICCSSAYDLLWRSVFPFWAQSAKKTWRTRWSGNQMYRRPISLKYDFENVPSTSKWKPKLLKKFFLIFFTHSWNSFKRVTKVCNYVLKAPFLDIEQLIWGRGEALQGFNLLM